MKTLTTRVAMTAALLALGGYVFYAYNGLNRRDEQVHASSLQGAAALRPMTDRWQLGETRQYQVTLRAQSALGANPVSDVIGLALGATAYEQRDAKTFILLTLRTQEVSQDRGGAGHGLQGLKEAIPRRAQLAIDQSGAIAEIRLPVDADPFAHYLVRSLAAELQLVFPPGASRDRWLALEDDATGDAEVEYRKLGPRLFRKTRNGYRRSITLDQRRGVAEVKTDPEGRIQSVSSHYEDSVASSGATRGREVWHRLDLVGVRRGDVLPELDVIGAWQRLWIGSNPRGVDQRIAAKYQLPEVLAILNATSDPSVRARYVATLEALLRVGGAAAARAVADAIRTSADEDACRCMVAAMEGAFTEHAQAELIALASDAKLSLTRRRDVLLHLGLGESPNAGTVHGLVRLSGNSVAPDPLGNAAKLALGGAVRRVDPDDDSAANAAHAAVAQLTTQLDEADTLDRKLPILSAIGNAGQRESLPAIQVTLRDEDPLLRARSVQALRHVPGDDVDSLISEQMLTDPDPRVRAASTMALQARALSSDATNALSEVMRTDRDTTVRSTAVHVVTAVLKSQDWQNSSLISALEEMARADPDGRQRDTASRALRERASAGEPAFRR